MLAILEPKSDGSNIERQARSLGFPNFAQGNPLNTHIWLFWSSAITVSDIQWHTRCVSCKMVSSEDGMASYWTYVYRTHDPHTRHPLWDEIVTDGQNLEEPWFILGDFNAISDWSENEGGDRIDDGSMIDFNIFQVHVGLTNLGFSRNPFTWSNNQQALNQVWQWLDRILGNAQGLSHFPYAEVTHLPRVCSDHYPLLFNSCEPVPRRSRFHNQKMWHKHQGFKEIVKGQWDAGIGKFLATSIQRSSSSTSKSQSSNMISRYNGKLKRLGLWSIL
ncbi:hypothetical protein QQ045_032981 [Rhodiola kirilowii]